MPSGAAPDILPLYAHWHGLCYFISDMKRIDLKKILVIGSGPIVIGQGCEFDYSGCQAVKALRQEVRGFLALGILLYLIGLGFAVALLRSKSERQRLRAFHNVNLSNGKNQSESLRRILSLYFKPLRTVAKIEKQIAFIKLDIGGISCYHNLCVSLILLQKVM